MRGINKKMLISILTSVIVLITIVATTFAWVGIFTYANTDEFSFNLKVSELDANHFLTISATGNKGSFGDEADIIDIKKQIIVNNSDISMDDIVTKENDEIDALYSRYCITTPSSCVFTDDGQLSKFYTVDNTNVDYYSTYNAKNSYLKFDIYLSVDTKEGIKEDINGNIPSDIFINSNVLLTDFENTLVGSLSKFKLTNLNPYKKMPSIPNEFSTLLDLPDLDSFDMNSANASRFALSIYNPININDSYVGNETPTKTLIYHGGEQLPTLKNDVFDLGGILPEEYNTALRELLIIRPNHKSPLYHSDELFESDLEKAIERGQTDLALVEDNSFIWSKPANPDTSPFLGVYNGVQTKQKITVYFWFEGWDADCLAGIDKKPVTLNLTLTAGAED